MLPVLQAYTPPRPPPPPPSHFPPLGGGGIRSPPPPSPQQQQEEEEASLGSSSASWPVFFDQEVAGWKCRFLDVEASVASSPTRNHDPTSSLQAAYPSALMDILRLGQNKETLGELFFSFFDHFARLHDYNNSVVSIRVNRANGLLSKREKDWTMRHGSERHLVCIEDPFELSHDLGRTIDKISVVPLRREIERAARILASEMDPLPLLFQQIE